MASAFDSASSDFILTDQELDELLVTHTFEIEQQKDNTNVPCLYCSKVCISQRGLNRHMQHKHLEKVENPKQQQTKLTAEEVIHPLTFKNILVDSCKNIAKDGCYPSFVSKEFEGHDCSYYPQIYELIKPVILKYKSKGDAEKFYPNFCSIFHGEDKFPGLSQRCNSLLKFELANNVLAFLAKSKIINDSLNFKLEKDTFKTKDLEIISYLSGYVVGTIYRRIRFKMQGGEYQNQCLSLLLACKLQEGSETDTSKHKLIDIKNRGGLWKIKSDGVTIFKLAETYFLSATKDFVSRIDAKHIVSLLIKDPIVMIYFGKICRSCELEISKEIAFNLLEEMFTLYVRVRSFSYAKDKQQVHKINKAANKSRSLRTELKKTDSKNSVNV